MLLYGYGFTLFPSPYTWTVKIYFPKKDNKQSYRADSVVAMIFPNLLLW